MSIRYIGSTVLEANMLARHPNVNELLIQRPSSWEKNGNIRPAVLGADMLQIGDRIHQERAREPSRHVCYAVQSDAALQYCSTILWECSQRNG